MPIAFAALIVSVTPANAESLQLQAKAPSIEARSEARSQCKNLFTHLEKGETQKIADWIITEIGYVFSEAERVTKRNDFKSKLDLILAGPPASPYGRIDGYDLISQSNLPGSDRYFRYTFISYHQGAPLMWTFRFYVKPDGSVALHFVTWSETDPFEYLSTPSMLLPFWSDN